MPYRGFTPRRLVFLTVWSICGYLAYKWLADPEIKRTMMLNGKNFTPFVLQDKEHVSSTSSILDLVSVPAGQNTDNVDEAWRLGIWSVQVLQPELQIARSYTPLPPKSGAPKEQIRLFVRQEPQGEVSRFLHRIGFGSFVSLRGPHPEFILPENIDEVLFLAGGTGIAPALQLIHCLLQVRENTVATKPKIKILWANRRREDSIISESTGTVEKARASILARVRDAMERDNTKTLEKHEETAPRPDEQTAVIAELEALRKGHTGKLDIQYFVDEEGTFITEPILRPLLLPETVDARAEPNGKKVLLVSGPPGFVETFAGPKRMQGGKELQGPLGGILKKLNPEGWSIWKL